MKHTNLTSPPDMLYLKTSGRYADELQNRTWEYDFKREVNSHHDTETEIDEKEQIRIE